MKAILTKSETVSDLHYAVADIDEKIEGLVDVAKQMVDDESDIELIIETLSDVEPRYQFFEIPSQDKKVITHGYSRYYDPEEPPGKLTGANITLKNWMGIKIVNQLIKELKAEKRIYLRKINDLFHNPKPVRRSGNSRID